MWHLKGHLLTMLALIGWTSPPWPGRRRRLDPRHLSAHLRRDLGLSDEGR